MFHQNQFPQSIFFQRLKLFYTFILYLCIRIDICAIIKLVIFFIIRIKVKLLELKFFGKLLELFTLQTYKYLTPIFIINKIRYSLNY